jgi:hypothetical protein
MTKERGGSLIFLAAGVYGLVFSIQLPEGDVMGQLHHNFRRRTPSSGLAIFSIDEFRCS